MERQLINDSYEDLECGESSRRESLQFSSRSSNSESSPDRTFSDDSRDNSHSPPTLRTFGGVICPVALSMFSAILFLRLGYILGHSGLYLTIVELLLAYTILIFTVLSVCAISTNEAIKGGGAYYMISRALGPEFGGSVGTLFFIANVFSSALYLTGCVEGIIGNFGPSGSILQYLPSNYWWSVLYASCFNFLNMLICLVGATLFAKTSVTIFVVVLICISSVVISFVSRYDLVIPIPHENKIFNHTISNTTKFSGFNMDTFTENLYPSFSTDYTTNMITSFPVIFGVMFSGVTGIMAGANISGELKDPSKSIPKGTLLAVTFTFFIYLFLFFITAATCPKELLQNNFLYMQPVDYLPVLVAIGIFAATFSASLSNLIGASRVLEALSRDELFGPLLSPIMKFALPGNPVLAVVVTWLLIQCIIFVNKLNTIAQITSVFFLLTYLGTNLACLCLTLTSAPNFRPTFKYFNGKTATFGSIGALVMMFVINSVYSAVTIVLFFLLFIGLHFRAPPQRWGSITQALIFHQVRKYLLILDSRKNHVKYWRPHILLMVSNPRSSIPLIQFANDLKKSGLFLIGHVKLGSLDDYEVDPIYKEYSSWLQLFDMLAVKAFFEVTMAATVREGFHHLVRITGLGAMKPNTVFFGFLDNEPQVDFFQSDPSFECVRASAMNNDEFLALRVDEQRNVSPEAYTTIIYESIFKFKKNVCIGRYFNHFRRDYIFKSKHKQIDIWPIDFFSNRQEISSKSWKFLLQLACILQMVPRWKYSTELRLFITDQLKPGVKEEWQKRLKLMRIDCTIVECAWNDDEHYQGNDGEPIEKRDDVDYFGAVNRFIRSQSHDASLIFVYLPPPPQQDQSGDEYLRRLTLMTDQLPPTILMHGITEVS